MQVMCIHMMVWYFVILCICTCIVIRRKFRSQTADSIGRWSRRGGKRQRRERQKKEDQGALKCFVVPEAWQVGSLKRRVRNHLGRWEMKNCTPLWLEADFEVKCQKHHTCGAILPAEMFQRCKALWSTFPSDKTPQVPSAFGSWDVEKVCALVARRSGALLAAEMLKSACRSARSTFRSENIQSAPHSDHFWMFKRRFVWQAQWILLFYKIQLNVWVL